MSENEKQTKASERIAMRVSRNSIFVNLLLAIGKLAAGIFGNSAAMVSDAVHSASDVFSTVIVMVGVKLSGKESDANHPYGHERLECVAAILLAVILAATGLGIGYQGIEVIWSGDAWHHRSDALSSVGSFAGILGAKIGFPVLDPVASIVISIFILKAVYDIFMDAVGKLTDEACDAQTVEQMRQCILGRDGVFGIDDIKTRMFGNKIYMDIEIQCDGNMTLFAAHEVAEDVHDEIERAFPNVKHCMVHVNPCRRE